MYTVCNTNIRNLDLFADNSWEKREFGGRIPTRQWRLVLLVCLQTYIVSVLPIPLQWMWFIFHACLQSIIADLCNRWQQFEWLRFVVIKEKLFTVSITSNLRQHNCTLLRSMSENGKWAIQICVSDVLLQYFLDEICSVWCTSTYLGRQVEQSWCTC